MSSCALTCRCTEVGHDLRHWSIPQVISFANSCSKWCNSSSYGCNCPLHDVCWVMTIKLRFWNEWMSHWTHSNNIHALLFEVHICLHEAWLKSLFIQRSPPNSWNSPAPCWAPIIINLGASVFNVGGAYQDYQDHGWGSFSEVEDNEEKIIHPSSSRCWQFTPWCHSPKMLSLMRWRIRNSPFVLWKEPKSLEEVFKIAERMELYARKVKPGGKDGF